ncbi:unnamed protein product [Kuraishia capsulata CBS 1993]|uniref:Ribosomal protein L27/L41, mitochondrial n=1 Tax=Kuraishia capsulata CBS 1993 TaxID=1382522 RepID=W6MNJ3_9ASCO|nr:uncharacterized protein KUCA_T00002585001 [Kuraishia capsulata CBS 1993]CDK26612.1 unnamed protein product [Kuraishia capsulata CBS 1993]
MRATQVTYFQETVSALLRRPWQTWRDGAPFYGTDRSGNKRLPMTTKSGNKNFYKGTRSSGIGKHTKQGGYLINYDRVRHFVAPAGLEQTNLKPYVSSNSPSIRHTFEGYTKGAVDPELYLEKVKEYVETGKVEYPMLPNWLERG